MKVYARDVQQVGMLSINKKNYRICTMTLYGKGTIATAQSTAVDDNGNLSFTHKTAEGKEYAMFNDLVIAQGSVYVNITKDADPLYNLYSEDDVGTSEEWQ